VWKEEFDIAYEDKEQVALLMGTKRVIRKRSRNAEKAQLIYSKIHLK